MRTIAEKHLFKAFRDGLDRILDANNGHSNIKAGNRKGNGNARLKKQASVETQNKRRLVLHLAFGQLSQLGYQLRSPENLGERHVDAIVRYWGEQKLSPSTLRTRISILNVFSEWINKRGIVKDPEHYFPDGQAKRTTIALEDKSWEAKCIDAEKKIAEALQLDQRFGAMLLLQYRFGLRMKESIEIHPNKALIDGESVIELFEGTKGGRPRLIRIETVKQRQTINLACSIAIENRTGRLRWPDCTWRQARNRFYGFMRKLGLTKNGLGVTAHGLRHEYSQDTYEAKTGLPSPIKGGALGLIDRATHEKASLAVSRSLGHGRVDVTCSYYGTYGHALRGTPSTADYVLKFNVSQLMGGQHGFLGT